MEMQRRIGQEVRIESAKRQTERGYGLRRHTNPCLGMFKFSRSLLLAVLLMSKANTATGGSAADLKRFVQQPSEERFLQVPTDRPVLPPISRPGGTIDDPQTASPTGSPILVPTGNPPQSPTRLPTRAPTLAPVRAPTRTPTRAPIVTPVVAPTPLPVETPATPVQTPSPTLAQTRLPTGDPSNVTISAGGSSTNIAGALAGGFAAFLLTGFCLFLIQRRKNSKAPPASEEKKKQERPHGTRPSIASTLSKRSARFMAELMLPPQEDVSTLGDPTFTSARMLTAAMENGEEHFKVVAPAGKLGMVLGTTLDGGTPIVHAIEETSPLADRVRVGDRLLSIDGEDCTGTAAVPIDAPELISRKSEKAARVLVFARYIDSENPRNSTEN
eukprot:Nitzschia sp. Nitz4//scaffold235_size30605//25584//26828//NITZ4_007981-RA/size30605-augustus-gene-0.22-mRNA-1//-1//CDS//3329543471//8957//frame0